SRARPLSPNAVHVAVRLTAGRRSDPLAAPGLRFRSSRPQGHSGAVLGPASPSGRLVGRFPLNRTALPLMAAALLELRDGVQDLARVHDRIDLRPDVGDLAVRAD